MMKGGYAAGVHTMRALSNMRKEDGEVILIIDFSNAFNSYNRKLLFQLAAISLSEITHLVFWSYTG